MVKHVLHQNKKNIYILLVLYIVMLTPDILNIDLSKLDVVLICSRDKLG